MIRCPYCGSHNVIALPLGDFYCQDCEEQFYLGERPSRKDRTLQRRLIKTLLRRGRDILSGAAEIGGAEIPAILKGASIFFL